MDLSDRCVKCGLCLPHCPTYSIGQVEGESPRGRIALMQGLASGALDATPGLVQHLDQCLGCRACESACPADVPYGQLIDSARSELRGRGISPGFRWRLVAWITASRLRMGLADSLLRLIQALRIDALLRRLVRRDSALAAQLAVLPPVRSSARFKTHSPPDKDAGAETIDLFLGCLGPTLEADTLQATQRVLNELGYHVRVPSRQGCCGAIYQHAGFPGKAAKLASRNLTAFDDNHSIVVVSTGCLATLREYPQLLTAAGQTHAAAQSFSERCVDVDGILVKHGKTIDDPGAAALHMPCTQRLCPDDASAALAITHPAGDGETVGNGQCCGAAGTYLIDQPKLSQALARRMHIPDTELILTSNIGCRLQLEAQCRERGIKARVAHPVSMLHPAADPCARSKNDDEA